MSKLKHTPGPWVINDEVDFDSFISGSTGKFENVICSSPRSYKRGKNGCKNYAPWHDNKLLIAAAPEMLDELLTVFKGMKEYDCGGLDDYSTIRLKDLIEKATGMSMEEVLSQ